LLLGKLVHSSTKASTPGRDRGREEVGPNHTLGEGGWNVDNRVFNAIFDHRLQVFADGSDLHPGDELRARLQDVSALLNKLAAPVKFSTDQSVPKFELS
jgi:hypothetical protein